MNRPTTLKALFPDPVFNIGSDETASIGPCSLTDTGGLERKLLEFLESTLYDDHFRRKFALEGGIEVHAFAPFEAVSMCVIPRHAS
jgi:hypothetical protein